MKLRNPSIIILILTVVFATGCIKPESQKKTAPEIINDFQPVRYNNNDKMTKPELMEQLKIT